MTLAEAFMERKDIQKKIDRATEELNSVLITEEGIEVAYNAKEKEKEVTDLMMMLFNLNIDIDKANEKNIEDLQLLRSLDREIRFYESIRNSLIHGQARKTILRGFMENSDTNIKMVKNLDVNAVAEKLSTLEKNRRDLDRSLQKKNWSINI